MTVAPSPFPGLGSKLSDYFFSRRFSEFTWFFDAYFYAKGPRLVNPARHSITAHGVLSYHPYGEPDLRVRYARRPGPIFSDILEIHAHKREGLLVEREPDGNVRVCRARRERQSRAVRRRGRDVLPSASSHNGWRDRNRCGARAIARDRPGHCERH